MAPEESLEMLQDAGVRICIPGTGLRKDRVASVDEAYRLAREVNSPVSPMRQDLRHALTRLETLEKHLLYLGTAIRRAPQVTWEMRIYESGTTIVTPASSVVYNVHFSVGYARFMQGDEIARIRKRHDVARRLTLLLNAESETDGSCAADDVEDLWQSVIGPKAECEIDVPGVQYDAATPPMFGNWRFNGTPGAERLRTTMLDLLHQRDIAAINRLLIFGAP